MQANLAKLKVGDELKSRNMKVTQEGISAFHIAFGGSNPLHTDPALAQKSGYGAPLQHGVRTLYPVFSAIFAEFPQLAAGSSRLSAKFIAPVEPGDLLTTHCRVTRSEKTFDQYVVDFETWVTNQNGTKVLVGDASLYERV